RGTRTAPSRAQAGASLLSAPACARKGESARCRGAASPSALVELEHRQERLLRHLDAADLLHPLLSLPLLLEQLFLARDVAAVALRDHVLAKRLDRLARDHVRADRGLNGDVVLLARDALAQLLGQRASHLVCLLAVHDQ